mmetsp:Transcript_6402/g.15059  ORF Transcript_6402/g.15059 Transcript_6402/m.15059 type:complete len:261 (+) Transcript_6402:2694-3476(+)
MFALPQCQTILLRQSRRSRNEKILERQQLSRCCCSLIRFPTDPTSIGDCRRNKDCHFHLAITIICLTLTNHHQKWFLSSNGSVGYRRYGWIRKASIRQATNRPHKDLIPNCSRPSILNFNVARNPLLLGSIFNLALDKGIGHESSTRIGRIGTKVHETEFATDNRNPAHGRRLRDGPKVGLSSTEILLGWRNDMNLKIGKGPPKVIESNAMSRPIRRNKFSFLKEILLDKTSIVHFNLAINNDIRRIGTESRHFGIISHL